MAWETLWPLNPRCFLRCIATCRHFQKGLFTSFLPRPAPSCALLLLKLSPWGLRELQFVIRHLAYTSARHRRLLPPPPWGKHRECSDGHPLPTSLPLGGKWGHCPRDQGFSKRSMHGLPVLCVWIDVPLDANTGRDWCWAQLLVSA